MSETNFMSYSDASEVLTSYANKINDKVDKIDTLPTPTIDLVGKVYLYTGTTGTYTKGGIYECQVKDTVPPSYEWIKISQDIIQYSTMPTASADVLGKVYQYVGATNANYTHNYFYECVSDGATPPTYSWENILVQAGVKTYDIMPSDAELYELRNNIFFTYGFYNKYDGCGGYYRITTDANAGMGGLKKEYNGNTFYLEAIVDQPQDNTFEVDVCRYGVRSVYPMPAFDDMTKANTYAQENSDIINNMYCPWRYGTIFKFPSGNFVFADPFNPKGGVDNDWFGAGIKGVNNNMDNRGASTGVAGTTLIFPFLSNGDTAIAHYYGHFEDFKLVGNPNQYKIEFDREKTYTDPEHIVTETVATDNGEQVQVTGMFIRSVGLVRNVSIMNFYTGIKTVGNRYYTDIYFQQCHTGIYCQSDIKLKGVYGWNVYELIDIYNASLVSVNQARVDNCVHIIYSEGNMTNSTFIDIDGDYCVESAIELNNYVTEGNKFIAVGGRCCAGKAYDSVNDTRPEANALADSSGYGVIRYTGSGRFTNNYLNLGRLYDANPFDSTSDIKLPTHIAFTFRSSQADIGDNVFEVTGVDDITDIPKDFQIRNTNYGIKICTGWDNFVIWRGGIKGMFTELMDIISLIPSDTHPTTNQLLNHTNGLGKLDTLPTASAALEGFSALYTGATTSTLTHGGIYECREVTPATDPATYEWVLISANNIQNMKDGTAEGAIIQGAVKEKEIEWQGTTTIVKPNIASGDFSHVEGVSIIDPTSGNEIITTASGGASHAEGQGSTASGAASHAEGSQTIASGDFSHAEGYASEANGVYSHAQNGSTIAQGYNQTVIGEWNVAQGTTTSRTGQDYAFIIGNGNNTARSNAFAIQWDGTFVFADGTTITPAQFAQLKALLS